MSYSVCRRHGLDPVLLWLWPRPADEAPIRPLAWEPPYAAGAALEKEKKKKKKPQGNTVIASEFIIYHHFGMYILGDSG